MQYLLPFLLFILPLIVCPFSYAQDEPVHQPGSFEIYPNSGLGNQFFTHREAEQNFYHCDLNNTQLYQVFGAAAPAVCGSPKISDFVDAVFACERSIECERQFSNGELWKPRSESNGNPVILMPIRYVDATIKVYGSDSNQEVADVQRETCCPNGNRKHWFLDTSCDTLQAVRPLQVYFNMPDGSVECRTVPDPCTRYE